MLNITQHYKLWFGISTLAVAAAVICLALYGLNLGIDFRGGTLTRLTMADNVPLPAAVRTVLAEAGFTDAVVQLAGQQRLIIRTGPQTKEDHDRMLKVLTGQYAGATEEQFTSIGPVIGKELRSKAALQLILVTVGIIAYIAYAFRKVSKPVSSWKFGVAAIIALVHDLLIVLGSFAVLGRFLSVEVDSLFITALLTVLGFSVHDTIVVFDRIRENLRVHAGQMLAEIINSSINQTLVRSINTSLTVLFVLMALLLFGGQTIFYFVLALFIGITAGTYSSIFIAAPLLLWWHHWTLRQQAG